MSCCQFLFSLQSQKTVQADGLVRPGLTISCTSTHTAHMCPCTACVCVCVCICTVYVCVLSVLQHRGAVEYQWRSLGLCLRPNHCAEEWKGEKEVESMASEGWLAVWLATANCICTISDKVPLCVMVLGGCSRGLPTKSNSLIW